jgi:sugar phosphate isomerase/epimerase
MRLAISNIAWPAGADEAAVPMLREHGATGVELALTKIWPEPLEVSSVEVARCHDWWESRGLPIVALQALLYGKPDLTLFDSPATRRATLDYLKGIIARAATLGATALVFGSPGNRRRRGLSWAESLEIAVPFFRELGSVAADQGVVFCIEPNPAAYGCDWVTDAAQAVELTDAVGSTGLGVHLDAAAMTLAADPAEAVLAVGRRCRHFHVSAPFLAEVAGTEVAHADFAQALEQIHYCGWVSIEMSEAKLQSSWQGAVRRALPFAREVYRGVLGRPTAPAIR